MVEGPDRDHRFSIAALDRMPWRSLARVCTDTMVRAHLRKRAEQRLAARLDTLALGERVALARIAPLAVLPDLARFGEPAVTAALLGNPRMNAAVLDSILQDDSLSPDVLRTVAEHHRWGEPTDVRIRLVTHRGTPVHTALRILQTLPRADLRRLLEDRALPPLLEIQIDRIDRDETE